MREKHLFEYAVIRLVPCVEREEFLNVGVIVYCRAQNFLQTAFELKEERLRTFAGELKLSEMEKHLLAFERICAGGESVGAIGRLPRGERFGWLTAPRSTVIQTSPVHTGLCLDAKATLMRLLAKLVQ